MNGASEPPGSRGFRPFLAYWAEMMRGRQLWAVFAALALLLGLVGPFGSSETMATGPRLAYWTLLMLLGWVLATGHVALAGQLAPRAWPPGAVVLLGAAAAGPAISGAVLLVNAAMRDGRLGFEHWVADMPMCCAMSGIIAGIARMVSPIDPPAIRAAAAVAPAALLVGAAATVRTTPRPRPASEAGTGAAAPALLDRLAPDKRGPLLRLAMQDHYVEIVTEAGSELVLLRLSDAIAEAAPEPGLQVHRSHWVARRALREAVRRDGRVFLRLADGFEAPVSRGRLPALREAGWID